MMIVTLYDENMQHINAGKVIACRPEVWLGGGIQLCHLLRHFAHCPISMQSTHCHSFAIAAPCNIPCHCIIYEWDNAVV